MGGAVLSDRKTRRDFRAGSEKNVPRFQQRGVGISCHWSSFFAAKIIKKKKPRFASTF